jgi:hypothetical protein
LTTGIQYPLPEKKRKRKKEKEENDVAPNT